MLFLTIPVAIISAIIMFMCFYTENQINKKRGFEVDSSIEQKVRNRLVLWGGITFFIAMASTLYSCGVR